MVDVQWATDMYVEAFGAESVNIKTFDWGKVVGVAVSDGDSDKRLGVMLGWWVEDHSRPKEWWTEVDEDGEVDSVRSGYWRHPLKLKTVNDLADPRGVVLAKIESIQAGFAEVWGHA